MGQEETSCDIGDRRELIGDSKQLQIGFDDRTLHLQITEGRTAFPVRIHILHAVAKHHHWRNLVKLEVARLQA